MLKIVLQRMTWLVAILWLAVTVTFFVLRIIPGNAIDAQYFATGWTDEEIEAYKTAAGLNLPLVEQYLDYLNGLIQGDLGDSLYTGLPVEYEISQRFTVTAQLAAMAMFVAITIGISLGLGSVVRWRRLARLCTAITYLSFGVPVYWTATLALFLVLAGSASQVILLVVASLVLGFHTAGAISRIIATEVRAVYHMDHVQVARARGLHEIRIFRDHILRLILPQLFTVIALQTGILLSGVVITESIFQQTGIGLLLLDRTLAQDYPVVQGIVILSVLVFTVANGIADFAVYLLDPRMRYKVNSP